jgi:hypothetical protein
LRSARGRQPGEIDDRTGARAEQDLAAGDTAGRIGDQPMIDRLVTDLPEPDSPTPRAVRPHRAVNETSSTAVTRPASVENCVLQVA